MTEQETTAAESRPDKLPLGRLNSDGISALRAFVERAADNPSEPIPYSLLSDPTVSTAVFPEIVVEHCDLPTRLDAGRFLFELLGSANLEGLNRDVGLWSWLSLFFADQLLKPKRKARTGEMARWILEPSRYNKYYRHLLAGPFRVYQTYAADPTLAKVVLANPLHTPGDVAEQIVSRQELVTNPIFMKVANDLYYDVEKEKLRPRAGVKTWGSSRRLADLVNQYDLTWNLQVTPADTLKSMLPKEFDSFRKT